jgi:hypothetical protein
MPKRRKRAPWTDRKNDLVQFGRTMDRRDARPASFAYADNYLVNVKSGIIMVSRHRARSARPKTDWSVTYILASSRAESARCSAAALGRRGR